MLAVRALTLHRSLHVAARLSADRLYTKKHEWISVSGDVGTVGITDFACEQLGDVVFVESPAVDTVVAKGDSVGAVESVKAASDIYSPVSGTVIESNEELVNDPSLMNKSPFEKGWLYKLRVKDASELKALLNEEAYSELKKEESH